MTKVLYLEGRPSAHVLHRRFAEAVSGEIRFVDEKLRWQDQNLGIVGNIKAWWKNARHLAESTEEDDILLVDNLHITPVLMNLILRFRGKEKKKLVVHLGSHTLYFMHAHRFKPANHRLHRWMLKKYDALICEGDMAVEFATEFYPDSTRVFKTFLGPPAERQEELAQLSPALEENTILILANGPGEFRKIYKGLDLMIAAFQQARKTNQKLQLKILGNWDEQIQRELLGQEAEGIDFVGGVSDVSSFFATTSLLLHASRGDAFPTSTIEAMSGGLPVMVSDLTGTREIVTRISSDFVVKPEISSIVKGIHWYFSLSNEERNAYAAAFRKESMDYTEESAIKHYRLTFERVIEKVLGE